MAAPPEASTPSRAHALVHSFMPGLRFPGALSYAACHQGRRRWIQVPMPQEPDAIAYATLAVAQAACVLTGRPATLRQLDRARDGLDLKEDPLQPLTALGTWGQGLATRPVPPAQVWERMKTGLAGHAWLLLVQGATANPSAKRWIWVTGLEHQVEEGTLAASHADPASHSRTAAEARTLRTVLVLDAALPSPWGTGFNARVEALNSPAAQTAGPSRKADTPHRRTWLLRGLDGHREALRLLDAMTLERI